MRLSTFVALWAMLLGVQSTVTPTLTPTYAPTLTPTLTPTEHPTEHPTLHPTEAPTHEPSVAPTITPTHEPSVGPTYAPTLTPTVTPTLAPTLIPTHEPTPPPGTPTYAPTFEPTHAPTSSAPTVAPTAPTMPPTDAPLPETIFDYLGQQASLSHFRQLLDHPEYESLRTLLSNNASNVTLFVPDNDAFARTRPWVNMTSNTALFHVVQGRVYSWNLPEERLYVAETLLNHPELVHQGGRGARLRLTRYNTNVNVTVGHPGQELQARVLSSNHQLRNGVVHVISEVLTFPNETTTRIMQDAGSNQFVIMINSLMAAHLFDATESITAFVATNNGLDRINATLPLFGQRLFNDTVSVHLVPGRVLYSPEVLSGQPVHLTTLNGDTLVVARYLNTSTITVNGQVVSISDVPTVNGVMHILDGVILPGPKHTYNHLENIFVLSNMSKLARVLASDPFENVRRRLTATTPSVTFFVPLNEALPDVDPRDPATFPAPQLIEYNLVAGVLLTTSLKEGWNFNHSLLTDPDWVNLGGAGQVLQILRREGTFVIRNAGGIAANILDRDQHCESGIIHTVNALVAPERRNISQILLQDANYATVLHFFNQSELLWDLDEPGRTIFAATNAAFEDRAFYETWPRAIMNDLLTYHTVTTLHYSPDMQEGQTIRTQFTPNVLKVTRDNAAVRVNGVPIAETDIIARNGVIHRMDRVLYQPAQPHYNMLVNLMVVPETRTFYRIINQSSAFSEFVLELNREYNKTLFVPSNQALQGVNASDHALLAAFRYHLVPQFLLPSNRLPGWSLWNTSLVDPQFVNLPHNHPQVLVIQHDGARSQFKVVFSPNNTANVVKSDLNGLNGIIHTIDRLGRAPGTASQVARAAGCTDFADLVEHAGYTDFDNFAGYTMFVPTNEALARHKIDRSMDVHELRSIFARGAFHSALYSTSIIPGRKLTAVSGDTYEIKGTNDRMTIGGQQFTENGFDLITRNGVLHVINGVLDPANVPRHGMTAGAVVAIILGVMVAILLLVFIFRHCSARKKMGTDYAALNN